MKDMKNRFKNLEGNKKLSLNKFSVSKLDNLNKIKGGNDTSWGTDTLRSITNEH